MGTVSFEVPGPGTYQVQCDPSLTPLTDPAAAGDVLAGKRFYNDQSQAVTGTLAPGSDTGDATATAGDILAPKTAYVAAGKVTGTIATKGASDVTADGPLVAVPPGYYPQAVNKTVSDPDLVPGNIKAGVDIFGVTGSLTSSFSAVLVVTVDAGAEVTATDGITTLTATSTGTATFHLPNGGTWTVSATLNGSQSLPATVEVQENFSVALSAGASQTVDIPTQYEAELSFTPSRLPEGYTEVEYIQSDGNQGIQTGEKPTANIKITIDVVPQENTSPSVEYMYFSNYIPSSSGTRYYFVAQWGRNGTQISNGSTGSAATFKTISSNTTERRIVIETDYQAKIAAIIGEAQVTLTDIATNTLMRNIILLNNSSFSTTNGLKAKLYSCQIEKGGTLTRNFVPCIDPNGAVGMYDLVGAQFYANAGTGTFIAGPAV